MHLLRLGRRSEAGKGGHNWGRRRANRSRAGDRRLLFESLETRHLLTGDVSDENEFPLGETSDDKPLIWLEGTTAVECDSAEFSVVLSHVHDDFVTVAYTTHDDTAVAGEDYSATSGALTIAPGQLSATFSVTTTHDLLSEGSEQFFVSLLSAENATIDPNAGTVTGIILDEEQEAGPGEEPSSDPDARSSNPAGNLEHDAGGGASLEDYAPVVDFSISEGASQTVIDLATLDFGLVHEPGELGHYAQSSEPELASVDLDQDLDLATIKYADGISGYAEITIGAVNHQGAFAERVYKVYAAPVNDPPVPIPAASLVINENSDFVAVPASALFTDRDHYLTDVTLTLVDNKSPTLLETSIDAETGVLLVRPLDNMFGDAELIVRATDAAGGETVLTLPVYVDAIPRTSIPEDFAIEVDDAAESITLSLAQYFTDDTAGGLTYEVEYYTSELLNAVNLNPTTGQLDLHFVSDFVGQGSIAVFTRDERGNSAALEIPIYLGGGELAEGEVATKPLISIEAPDREAGEVGPNTGLFMLTCEGACANITVALSVTGTAIVWNDYRVRRPDGTYGTFPTSVKFTTAGAYYFDIFPISETPNYVEGTENVIVSVLAKSTYGIRKQTAEVKIEDAVKLPIVWVTADRHAGEGSTTTGLWRVRRDVPGPEMQVMVQIGDCPSPSTACSADYSLVSPGFKTVKFAAGSFVATYSTTMTPTLELRAVDDSMVEGTESVQLKVLPATGYIVRTNDTTYPDRASINITDNDVAGGGGGGGGTGGGGGGGGGGTNQESVISISGASGLEGSALSFKVTVEPPTDKPVSVYYYTTDGSAISPDDYNGISQSHHKTLTFAPREKSKMISISTVDDSLCEPTESFYVNLEYPINAKFGVDTAKGEIDDYLDTPNILVGNASTPEGQTAKFNLSFANGKTCSAPVTIQYETADGSAKQALDYTKVSSTATIEANQSSLSVSVPTLQDQLVEGDEKFALNVSSPKANSAGTGTIVDDDQPKPTIAISDVKVTEGNSGTVDAIFTVKVDGNLQGPVTLNYATQDEVAKAGSPELDYQAITDGYLSFSNSESQTITVKVNGDMRKEYNETFYVNLTLASGGNYASISDGLGVGTIEDDDQAIDPRLILHLPHCICPCNPCDAGGQEVEAKNGGMTVQPQSSSAPLPGYQSDSTFNSRPIFNVVMNLPADATLPKYIQATPKVGPKQGDSNSFRPGEFKAGAQVEFGVMMDVADLETGVYPLTIDIQVVFNDGKTAQSKIEDVFTLINLTKSSFGKRGSMSGLNRLLMPKSGSAAGSASGVSSSAAGVVGSSAASAPASPTSAAAPVGLGFATGDNTAWWFPSDGSGYASPRGSFLTLVKNNTSDPEALYTLTDKYGEQQVFNKDGFLRKRIDRNLNETVYTYLDSDGDGVKEQLLEIKDPLSRKTTYKYLNGKLDRVIDFAGRETRYVYSGQTLRIEHPLENGPSGIVYATEIYTFDLDGRVISSQDKRDQITQYTFDPYDKRLASIKRPDGTTTFMSSAQRNGLPGPKQDQYYDFRDPTKIYATVLDGRGNTTRYRVDDFGNLVEKLAPDANANTKIERDPKTGLIKKMILPAANGASAESVTEFLEYDSRGNLTKMKLPNGSLRTWAYDPKYSQVTSYTDELGRETRYALDDRGNVVSESHAQLSVAAGSGFEGAVNRPWQNPRNRYDVNEDGLVSVADVQTIFASGFPILPDPPPSGNKPPPYLDVNGDGRASTNDALQINNYLNSRNWVVTTFTYTAPGAGLPAGLVLSTTDPLGNRTENTYSTSAADKGWLKRVKYAAGTMDEISLSYEYDSMGNVTGVIDPLQHRTEYQFDLAHRLRRVIGADPDGVGPQLSPQTVYEYDKQGNLTKTTDANQRTTMREYDALHRLKKVTLPVVNGVTATNEFTYDANGNLTSVKDAEQRETRYQYNQNNWLTVTTFPAPTSISQDHGISTIQHTYDRQGNIATTIDQLNRVTTFTYDVMGRVVQVLRPGETSGTQFTYDLAGQRTSIVDPLGRDTRFAYDDLGRQVAVSQPNPVPGDARPLTVFAYDDANNLRFMSDPLRSVTEHQYNKLNRRTKTLDADPDGTGPLIRPETNFTYYANGQLWKTRDPLGRETELKYDNLDRLKEQILPDPDGSGALAAPKVITTYDAIGNVIEQTEVNGATNLTTRFEYQNPLYLVSKTVDPNGKATDFTYDRVGNRRMVRDADNNTTLFVYDALNRQIEERNPLNKSQYSHYDAVGNLTWIRDRNGRKIEYGYDALDRVTSEKWSAPNGLLAGQLAWKYDAAGQLLEASDPTASYAFVYDRLGRIGDQRVTLAGAGQGVIELDPSYDAVGNRTSLTARLGAAVLPTGGLSGGVADFVNTYSYDKLNRLTSVAQQSQILNPQPPPGSVTTANAVAPKLVQFSYKPDSQLDAIRRFSDVAGTQLVASSSFSYDGTGRLNDLNHRRASGTTIVNHHWDFDAANRVTRYDNSVEGSVTYGYDNKGQVKTANQPGSLPDESYAYSGNGNRTSGGYSFGANNRLTSDSTFEYQYDDEGNRTKRTRRSDGSFTEYLWDHRNRLTGVNERHWTGTITKRTDYTYDVFGQRISKQVDSDGAGPAAAWKEFYLWDDDQIVLSFRDANVWDTTPPSVNHRFLYGSAVDMILAEENVTETSVAGTVLWSLTDNQGTVRDVIDNNGAVLNHITYGAFGNVTSETNAAVDFLFGYTGRDRDEETGLNYYRARYYDPSTGRFISEDPISFDGGDTNLNRYVGNSPANGTDPSGLKDPTGKVEWGLDSFWGATGKAQQKGVGRNQFLRSQLLCETTGSNAGMRYSAQFQGEWPGAALDAAEDTTINVASTFIPLPFDDALVHANRYRTARKFASAGPKLFEFLAAQATRNPTSKIVVLGKSLEDGKKYMEVAAHFKATYFKIENWKELTKRLSRDEVWKVNEAFLDQQIKAGKQIICSHDPAIASGMYAAEIHYLESHGYNFVREGWIWKAVKK